MESIKAMLQQCLLVVLKTEPSFYDESQDSDDVCSIVTWDSFGDTVSPSETRRGNARECADSPCDFPHAPVGLSSSSAADASQRESVWLSKKVTFVKKLDQYTKWCVYWDQRGCRSEWEPVTPRQRAGMTRAQLEKECLVWRRTIVQGPPS
eukprot:TRINITY_DN7126_c0_g1_i2.p1 TRINITY_DN7126_c0_g1~~TRINITY_DN7126_c0_g1_i2.p1  ORF type:complete len:151 (+),score=16.45 TRINITY_DN7126_c0_g1_i2:370-822(+)